MSAARSIRVLVAEDEPNMRAALSDLIRGAPTLELVAAVSDAAQAVEMAAAHRPDVALVDVRMPAGGGTTAARGIMASSPGTRVLAHSAADSRASVVEMLEAGAVGYLIKGVDPGRIVESIESAAAGHATLSTEVTGGVIKELVERGDAERRDALERRASRERIEHAIADRAALWIVFQPICTLEGERVIAVEALSRFAGPPERSVEKWFSEAHEVGLGVELELAAVERALDVLGDLPPTVALSINISPDTAASSALRDLLVRSAPGRVIIEITEHARIDDYDALAATLSDLRALGVRVAVDDAGAGFASLRHILLLDPQFIKLDRTLIEDISSNRSRQALAAGLISFAEVAEAIIVAEGVERSEEVDALRDLGVSHGQGFFLARPTAPELLFEDLEPVLP